MLTGGGTGTGQADVYPIIVVAKDAFSVVPLVGKDAVDMSIIQPKKTETDPLAQRGVIGWKAWDSCVILQQAFVCRLEVAASQL
jgi:N4-gp56 family major capsid protein